MYPPSFESEIFTLPQLTGAAVVPATFQVTVCVVKAVQLTEVLGAVTVNGPEVFVTVIFFDTSLYITPLPPIRLSLTVNLKSSNRKTDATVLQ